MKSRVDFGDCGLTLVGNRRRRLSVFVMVPCYSRLMYVAFVLRQTLDCFLACHRHAFEAFGGVVGYVIVDRAKVAIIGEDRFGKPIPNPRYADMARHYGFDIRACAKGRPREKGRVENGIGYVKGNFMNGRQPGPFLLTCEGLQARHVKPLSHRRKILALLEIHGPDRLLRALDDAGANQAFSAEYIANLLQFRTHLQPPSPLRLARHACIKGVRTFFTTAIDIVNDLAAAQQVNCFAKERHKYVAPTLLAIDELGYLPIDQKGADILFQVVSKRYERGSILLTTNRVFREWPKIFNNDSMLASALLDRLLEHAEVVLVKGQSYRTKGEPAG